MKRIIRLTESDLTRIVRRVILEQDTVIPTPSESAQRVPDIDHTYIKVEKINLPNGVYKGMNGNRYFYVCDSNGSFTGYVVEGDYWSRGETPVDNQNIGIYNGENLSNNSGEKGGWYKDVGYIVSK
jgi:hypothetical protein